MNRFLLSLLVIILLSVPFKLNACFTMVAGKKATRDGSVMLGHNEDNGAEDIAGITHYPTRSNEKGMICPPYAAIEMPYLRYADNMINEYGVTLVANMCRSREEMEDIKGKGVGGREFRHKIIRQATTAREAVLLIGRSVEALGYIASGRTLTICDPNEAWVLSLVKGRHWVAKRVPDDEVACIANTYTIHEVDLKDSQNYLGSKDLVGYAQSRGWHKPGQDRFDFEKA